MNFKRIKYKINEDDEWKIGYIIGKFDGHYVTLLDENFEYVPKITVDEKKYIAYDLMDDFENYLNITMPL